jgi:hypothetical protein
MMLTNHNKGSAHVYAEPISMSSLMSDFVDAGPYLSAIIILNQALTYHCLGQSRPNYLKKALKLYRCALNLSVGQWVFKSRILFNLACLNNMGVIYNQLEDDSSSKMCFRQLMSMLMVYLHIYQGDSSKLVEYFQSVSHLILQTNPSPASAA